MPTPHSARTHRFSRLIPILVCATVAVGCSANEPDDQAVELTIDTPSASGAIDTLNWALPFGEPTSIDPALVGDYSPQAVSSNLCEGLVRLNADLGVEMGLAESIETPDSLTMIFNLRPGVAFTNGDPLTTEDVVYSLKRHMDPSVGSFWAYYYDSVKSIEATGPAQVTVKFTEHSALFEQWMGTVGGYISQKSYAERAGKEYGTPAGGVMCTGPFSLQSWRSGESITLLRNDNYWDPERRPHAAEVEFTFLSDASTLTSALLSGEIDGAYEAPVTSREALANTEAGTLYTGPSTQIVELLPTETDGPMSDPDVRTALDMAIDKEALVENVYGGAAEPLKTFIPPFTWGTGDTREIYESGYDDLPGSTTPQGEEAKELIAQANLDSTKFTVAVGAGDQAGLQTLTFVQAAAKEIGLDMTIRQFPPTQLSSMFFDETARADVDMLYALGYIEIANPLQYVPYFVTEDGLFNWTGYDNQEVQGLISEAMSEEDPKASAQDFVDAQAIYQQEMLVIPLLSPNERLFMNNGISGAPAAFSYINMPWAAMIGGTE